MVWAEAVPNLLIALREGLEAGLVITILLAAVAQRGQSEDANRISSAPVWLGVGAALSLAASFAAVLTFTTAEMSTSVQEGVSGTLGVIAVGLITWMVFWMRRTAPGLSRQIKGDVARAAAVGTGALTLTAFLAVGREGLETTLFIWTAVRASGSTISPLVGAATGLVLAMGLCYLLYKRAIKLNLSRFFTVTGIALIIIAAGILAYSLGDLQEAGWLPGHTWLAFDLHGSIDPASWWVTVISGVTNLTVTMTVLQIVAWIVFLALVLPAFIRATRTPPPKPADLTATDKEPTRWERLVAGHMWPTAACLVLTPIGMAALIIALIPAEQYGTQIAVSVNDNECAKEWKSASGGTQTFQVENKSAKVGEVNLVNSSGGVVGEIETLGPGTTADMTAVLGDGDYTFKCYLSGQLVMSSAAAQITNSGSTTSTALKPVSIEDLTPANDDYQRAAAQALDALTGNVTVLKADLARGDMEAAKADLLAAQMNWERVGASYFSFGEYGEAVSGLQLGLPGGVNDPDFKGLHRLEYGIYHGQPSATLIPIADQLLVDIKAVKDNLGSDDLAGDPANLPLRTHEILEDAQRDHISGIDDLGGGTAYPATAADIDITRTTLNSLAPLINDRSPQLVSTINTQLNALSDALNATRGPSGQWRAPAQVPAVQRQDVNAALGAVLETLSIVPALLEIPPDH